MNGHLNVIYFQERWHIQPSLAVIDKIKAIVKKHSLLSFWLIAVNESSGLTATWWIGAPNRGRNCCSCVFHCQRTNTPSSPTESRLEPLKTKNRHVYLTEQGGNNKKGAAGQNRNPSDKTCFENNSKFHPSLNSNNSVLSTSVVSSGCWRNQEEYAHANMT